MISFTLVTSQLHFEMCAGLYGHPVHFLQNEDNISIMNHSICQNKVFNLTLI